MPYRYATILLVLSLPLRALAAPATTAATTQPTEKPLTLAASPITRPELRYHLLPMYTELKPGNAAALYLLAMGYSTPHGGDWDKMSDWVRAAPADIPRPQADNLAASMDSGSLHTLDLAARREDCKWEFGYREDGFKTLLPHLSDIRYRATSVALRARLQIIDRKWDDAAHTLQTGFAMVYHLNHDAVIVQELVAAGIAQLMLEQVDLWVATPGSPNLYWPLTNLPEPMIDLRRALEREAAFTEFGLPHFAEARAGKLTPEGLQEMTATFNGLVDVVAANDKTPWTLIEQALAFAQGKQWLAARGHAHVNLDRLQPSELIGQYVAESYDEAFQSLLKWSTVPYWQASEGLQLADRQLKGPGVDVITRTLLPALSRATLTAAMPQRHVDELRTLEAVRAHAATHAGQLPATLADLHDLPLPTDPLTGKPFEYRKTPGGFKLIAPAPVGGRDYDGAGYDITFSK